MKGNFYLGLKHRQAIVKTDREGHLVSEAVEDYLMRRLPQAEADEVEQHLLICESCRDELVETETYLRAMKGAARRLSDNAKNPDWKVPFLIPALILAGLLLGAVALRFGTFSGSGSQATIQLFAVRGSTAEAIGPARRPLLLQPDLNGLSPAAYRIAMVDGGGSPVWLGSFTPPAFPRVPAQPPGLYFVRISSPSGQLLREYALRLGNAN
jgi:hypothetical protein